LQVYKFEIPEVGRIESGVPKNLPAVKT
jgi:hypothetical protein